MFQIGTFLKILVTYLTISMLPPPPQKKGATDFGNDLVIVLCKIVSPLSVQCATQNMEMSHQRHFKLESDHKCHYA